MTRIDRIEFTKAVKLEMFRRAGGPERLCCEGCGLPIGGKPFEYDHVTECWEMREKKALTAEDGKVLGRCCHEPKTARKAAERAHGNRILEKTARAKPRRCAPIPGSRSTNWKRKLDGTIERRS